MHGCRRSWTTAARHRRPELPLASDGRHGQVPQQRRDGPRHRRLGRGDRHGGGAPGGPRPDATEEGILYHLDPERFFLLANTAGCYTADEAIRYARLAREAGFNDFIKLEVIGDKETLLPDTAGLLAATRTLVKEGFKVLAYTNDDLITALRLQDAGAAAVMPLASPIGSGLGLLNPYNIRTIKPRLTVPVIVDAGVGHGIGCLPGDGAGGRRHPDEHRARRSPRSGRDGRRHAPRRRRRPAGLARRAHATPRGRGAVQPADGMLADAMAVASRQGRLSDPPAVRGRTTLRAGPRPGAPRSGRTRPASRARTGGRCAAPTERSRRPAPAPGASGLEFRRHRPPRHPPARRLPAQRPRPHSPARRRLHHGGARPHRPRRKGRQVHQRHPPGNERPGRVAAAEHRARGPPRRPVLPSRTGWCVAGWPASGPPRPKRCSSGTTPVPRWSSSRPGAPWTRCSGSSGNAAPVRDAHRSGRDCCSTTHAARNCPVSPRAPSWCRIAPRRWSSASRGCPPAATVYDACAAPGGKTHGAGPGRRTGDRRGPAPRPGRAGWPTTWVAPAAAASSRWSPPPPHHRAARSMVLLDAPCLGTGTFARHPDARWRVRPRHWSGWPEQQGDPARRRRRRRGTPGGWLVYATCSLEPEENEEQVNAFLARHPEFRRDPPDRVSRRSC